MSMIIPPHEIPPATLANLLEEYITREGTDYGEVELSLADKISRLRPQVLRGEVLIVFDEHSQCVNLVKREDLPRAE